MMLEKKRNGESPKTLGPLSNLEAHVPQDWWNRLFNSTYLKTDADVVDDAQLTRSDIDFVVQLLDLKPDMRVLDLCCGHGRHVLELARRGYAQVEGIDRSHYLITKARQAAGKAGQSIRFREGDARKLPYSTDTFDAVLVMGNSFGYFETEQDDLKVLAEIARVLRPGGRLLMDLADGEFLRKKFQPRSWEWISDKLFVCRERELSRDKKRLISREVVTDVTKGVVIDQFYAERLYSQEAIAELLKASKFSAIEFGGKVPTSSARNQDLGMMERRIILTSQIIKDWTPKRARIKNQLKHVVVVLGDPRKTDVIKPAGVFDEDDFRTLELLKEALSRHREYRFTYLDNHATLLKDLSQLTGKVDLVLNLCDEGFMNDAYLELHVPGLLETLGIPYSGSGPRCLAYCYDKSLVRGLAKEMGIPVPEGVFVQPEQTVLEQMFEFPVIVKPNFGDSSFGITADSVVHSPEGLIDAVSRIRDSFGYDKPILVEEFLTGKDLSVGIIGTPPSSYRVLPITEEDYSVLPLDLPQICGYEAKWDPQSPYWKIRSIPAQLDDAVREQMVTWCVQLSERLECRDYTRFDWRLDAQGNPRLLEVNPNPGWCWDGHLAKMAAHTGVDYSQLLRMIIEAAFERVQEPALIKAGV